MEDTVATRKILSQAASRALTREKIIDAAEMLLFDKGYFATSLTAIAAEAGYTAGAVYSNFDNKETLCREVLRRWGTARLTILATNLAACDGTLEGWRDVIASWWTTELVSHRGPMVLAAEYAIAVMRDPEERAVVADVMGRLVTFSRPFVADLRLEQSTLGGESMESAVLAVLSTGVGLYVGCMTGSIEVEKSAEILVSTMQFWIDLL
ncbi:TetR/AcrR family transcriptional regulator [Nocardia brasiliensis]|uniref:TetR/AcrR family transcriptional regulator n=1 Tax=Nocardia brasiliensis TaxID=37326 RepID=UPI0037B8213D